LKTYSGIIISLPQPGVRTGSKGGYKYRAHFVMTLLTTEDLTFQGIIIIAGSEKAKGMLEKHPFMRESSVIVESVEELLEKKWVQILYKSLSSTIY